MKVRFGTHLYKLCFSNFSVYWKKSALWWRLCSWVPESFIMYWSLWQPIQSDGIHPWASVYGANSIHISLSRNVHELPTLHTVKHWTLKPQAFKVRIALDLQLSPYMGVNEFSYNYKVQHQCSEQSHTFSSGKVSLISVFYSIRIDY